MENPSSVNNTIGAYFAVKKNIKAEMTLLSCGQVADIFYSQATVV